MNQTIKGTSFPLWVGFNWIIFALPGVFMLAWDASTSARVDFVRYTGLVCTWFLILSLMVTPLLRVLPAGNWRSYLRKNRRYLGVSAFWYTVLHLAYYVKGVPSIKTFLSTFVRFEMLTGWVSMFIMVALTWTSFDKSVQKLGPKWRRLHQLAYIAALLAFVHWAMAGHKVVEPVLYFLPLIALRLFARRA